MWPPLTAQTLDEWNAVGVWINESFIVRLMSYLEWNRIVGKHISIDKSIEGWRQVDLLRRISNRITHAGGTRYDAEDSDLRRLRTEIRDLYKLQESDLGEGGHLPIPIHKVIDPMTDGTISYIKALAAKQQADKVAPKGAPAFASGEGVADA